eukprot:Gregarina_sp_Pseudo_9__1575@NODE_2058_length_1177_cov_22_134446_g1900_i0_p2_GENE_NODE_2058_length_1177_cov_22_134446_g1900_i0NODE_2058_length_1177_cov_22_134446_g1900_i0_p2_ORF_typecomplete_len204_score67_64CMD/PF02627_20/7_1e05CMD/PF02627_20/9_8e07_NODE_2058_length_1177_cov_22_134446_g1900_i05041115
MLSPKLEAVAVVAALTAKGDLKRLNEAVNETLSAKSITVNEIREVLIQMYAYCGFPRSLNALGVLLSVVEERRARGVKDEVGRDASPLDTDKPIRDVGREVQTQLLGRPLAGPLFDFAPAINEFLQSHLFGAIFARDVLSHQEREVATVAALASLEGVEPQLRAHVEIAQRAGVAHSDLEVLSAVLIQEVGEPEGNRLRQVVG